VKTVCLANAIGPAKFCMGNLADLNEKS